MIRVTSPAVAVIAKSPRPGAVKTRLSPPLTPDQAAALAEAALTDTLAVVASLRGVRKVVVLAGAPGPWLPSGVEVMAQRGAGLDRRLANAFVDLGGPAVIIGMDTPQLRPEQLQAALAELETADAVLGPAIDGGYWAIGLRRPDPDVLIGVPMSSRDTLAAQRARLRALGLEASELQTMRDVDTFADAVAVAGLAPRSRFAAALAGAEARFAA